MITGLILFCLALIVVVSIQGNRLSDYREAKEIADRKARNAETQLMDFAERISQMSTLNTSEIMEAMTEQNTVITVDSNIWEVELTFGKWVAFPAPEGTPESDIRGFWYDCPGRLIGVKMPIGSRYELHFHPWTEILVGLSGTVTVQIENENGAITEKTLGPEDVIVIPPNAPHAVLEAETYAQFICVWGLPKPVTHD